jgi:hypothetical protein
VTSGPVVDDIDAAFAAAQRAMAAGDWDGFFAAIATKDLRRLATMGLGIALGPHADAAREMLADHGIDVAAVGDLADLADRITASAGSLRSGGTARETRVRSLAHRDLVKAYEKAARDIVVRTTDLPRLVGAIERFRRRTEGGGSVSSRLFLHETLADVVVDGKTAVGVRRYADGTTDPVRFVFERGGWKVSIFGR